MKKSMLNANLKFIFLFFCGILVLRYFARLENFDPIIISVQINSPIGVIEGFEHQNTDGSKSHVYLGIPYARTPIGEFRFKLSVKNANGFPVLVFIHGGGFVTGDAEQFGYKSLSENFAAFGIIAVTIQYRIGPLGFFSTGDDVMPGNIGLWDQMLALQFLHECLPSFGGNIQEITVWGNSAGAASVHALSISPHSQFLFKRAIQSSGSLFAAWAFNENVVDNSLKLAKYLNCSNENSKIIQACMKIKTIDEILEATDQMGGYNSHIRQFTFNPRFDREFFPASLKSLMKSSRIIPTLLGLAEKESAIVVNAPGHPLQKIQTDKGLESFIKNFTNLHEEESKEKALLEALYEYFVDQNGYLIKTKSKNWHLNQIVNIMSDLMFIVPVISQINAREALKQESYLFYQKHYPRDFNGSVQGAFHGNEMKYVFSQEVPDSNFSENDKTFQKNLLDGFRRFILTGKPKSSGIQWPTSGHHGIRHIVLSPYPIVEETFESERMQFWMNRLPAQVGKNIVRKTILPQTL